MIENSKNKQGAILLSDDLMRRVAEKDDKAFEDLYVSTRPAVYCMILSIVKNPSIAEDLMQDTYMIVKKSVENYEPQQKPMAWLYTIVIWSCAVNGTPCLMKRCCSKSLVKKSKKVRRSTEWYLKKQCRCWMSRGAKLFCST